VDLDRAVTVSSRSAAIEWRDIRAELCRKAAFLSNPALARLTSGRN
jgi:hypothetical protein